VLFIAGARCRRSSHAPHGKVSQTGVLESAHPSSARIGGLTPGMASPPVPHVTIATRESSLALWQAEHIRDRLLALYSGLDVRILGMTTQGDRMLSASLAKIGGKGLFVKDLESALQDGRADIAVHSMKDVPMELPPGFTIAAITEREDPRDAFVSNQYARLASLPPGSRIGTSSLRRESQLRARYPQLAVTPLRGNVQTRLRKLDEGKYSAIILAAAGLKRLGLSARITALLPPEESIPAAGQGALGIECLEAREELMGMLAPLNHAESAWCVRAERSVSRALSGSCVVPLGAYAHPREGSVSIRGFVASPDGKAYVCAEERAMGFDADPEQVGQQLAVKLVAGGAREILAALAHGQ
jgi:hydroxymethylbilane synthase